MNTPEFPAITPLINAPNARWTIGFLTSHFADFRFYGTWTGIADVARENGANLICFPVQDIASESAMNGNMAAVLCDLINPAMIDGLITHQWWSSREWFERIVDRYHPLPIVTIFREYPGYPGVIADNYQGMREALRHLIEDHGYRRIAYIRGPEGTSADERYRAYADILEHYRIPRDAALIIPGDHTDTFGPTAIRMLFDDRTFRPGIDIEAIVSSNDSMVPGMLEALQHRGIRVPADIAVIGFDDETWTAFTTPPLTTTAVSWYELGRRAAEELIAVLAGQHVPEAIMVPTTLKIRWSCGCVDQNIRQAAAGPRRQADLSFEDACANQRATILAAFRQAGGSFPNSASDWAEQLFDAFSADVRKEDSEATGVGKFLPALANLLFRIEQYGADVAVGNTLISELRGRMLPYLASDQALLARADDVWQQGRVLVSEIMCQARMRRQANADRQIALVRKLGQRLISTFDVGTLMNILATGLPRLGIPAAYLIVYDDPHASREWSRLILAYDDQGQIDGGQGNRCFRTDDLLPEGLLFRESARHFVIEPLYFEGQHLGLILFEIGCRDGALYDVLRGEISNALQGAFLVERVQTHAYELTTAYEEIRILNDQLKEENFRMSAELDVSRRIQQMILPPPAELAQIADVDVVGYMQPADEMGGDYYDVFESHGIIHIGIGDVTGHGLESGVLMLMIQTAVRALIERGETDPVAFLNTLNRTLYHNTHRMNVDKTLTFSLIKYHNGQLTIIGQHEEVLVVRKDGRIERVDTLNLGFPLGLEEDIAEFVAETTITLQPDDGIVLYTDGITEAENIHRELYGLDRLCTIVSQSWPWSAERIRQAVIDDVMAHIGAQKVYDDLTLLVLKQRENQDMIL